MEMVIPLYQGLSLKIGDPLAGRQDFPTGHLQKGFLLLDQGQELAEEAVGFGVPILKRGFQAIFPGAVALTWLRRGSTWDVTAQFKLNLVEKISKRGNKNVENRLLYAIKNFLGAVIRGVPLFRGLLTVISNKLRELFDWDTTYVDSGFPAELKVFFTVDVETGKVGAEIDTSGLPPDITEVVVLNEQGAHHFDHYLDTSGISLLGEQIGCWDEVSAQEAWFESSNHHVSFRLGQVKGVRLLRGRELIGSRLAWAGFGYSFPPSINRFRYEIRIEKLA